MSSTLPQLNMNILGQTSSFNMSNKYQHISTQDVINSFDKDWIISSILTGNKYDPERSTFQRHHVKLRNEKLTNLYNNGLIPEIIISNSYDGTSRLNINFGIFRKICNNGLIVKENQEFTGLSIKHIGQDFNEKIESFLPQIEPFFEKILLKIEKSKQIILSEEDQKDFVKELFESKKHLNNDFIDYHSLLNRQREEDKGNDMFSIFNVLQENLLQGNYEIVSKNKNTRKARKIISISNSWQVNQNLWNVFDKRVSLVEI